MKINSSLFAVTEKMNFKSESLVDLLYLTYEKNFEAIESILFSSSTNVKQLKCSNEPEMRLLLSSIYDVPDIQIVINWLSIFTADVFMYYKDNQIQNIKYEFNVKFRLFLDAKILEVKETGLYRSNYNIAQNSELESYKKFSKKYSVQDKLTKNLLVREWLNTLVGLEYTLNKK